MGLVELNDTGQMLRCMKQFRPLLPWVFLPLSESQTFSRGWSSVSAVQIVLPVWTVNDIYPLYRSVGQRCSWSKCITVLDVNQ